MPYRFKTHTVDAQLLSEYGLAMREAQRLERRLRQVSAVHQLAIRVLRGEPAGKDDYDFDRALMEGNGRTLGKLYRRYAAELSAIGAPLPLQDQLDDIVQLRNFLAHHFFERQRYHNEQSALPKVIRDLPGDHLFTEEYLDNIQEPHPTAMAEVRAALEQLRRQVGILDDWLFKILDALGMRPY